MNNCEWTWCQLLKSDWGIGLWTVVLATRAYGGLSVSSWGILFRGQESPIAFWAQNSGYWRDWCEWTGCLLLELDWGYRPPGCGASYWNGPNISYWSECGSSTPSHWGGNGRCVTKPATGGGGLVWMRWMQCSALVARARYGWQLMCMVLAAVGSDGGSVRIFPIWWVRAVCVYSLAKFKLDQLVSRGDFGFRLMWRVSGGALLVFPVGLVGLVGMRVSTRVCSELQARLASE